mgnify:FL=1
MNIRMCGFRFTNIATVVLDYGVPELYYGSEYSDWQRKHVRKELQKLVKARSRIILLHTQ